MNFSARNIGLPLVVLLAMAGVFMAKYMTRQPGPMPTPVAVATPAAPQAKLPKLLDLGSVGCVACKQMEPILGALRTELAGKAIVQFIDISKDDTAADRYKVDLIPTQIFYDADGKELFRHVGVYPKAEILAKMKGLHMLAK